MGYVPLPQSGTYYCTHCLTYTVRCVLARPRAVRHNANTTVRVACITYTIYSVVVRIVHRSRVPGATNSPKPNFHNDGLGSVGLGNASINEPSDVKTTISSKFHELRYSHQAVAMLRSSYTSHIITPYAYTFSPRTPSPMASCPRIHLQNARVDLCQPTQSNRGFGDGISKVTHTKSIVTQSYPG